MKRLCITIFASLTLIVCGKVHSQNPSPQLFTRNSSVSPARSDAQIEIQGQNALLSLFQTGDDDCETAIVFSAYDPNGIAQKTASISSKQAFGFNSIRLNPASMNGGTRMALKLHGTCDEGQGNGSATFFAFDSTPPPPCGQLDIIGNQMLSGSLGIGTSPNPYYPFYLASNGQQIAGTNYSNAFFGNASQTKGLYLGYDSNSQMGTITSQGANSGLSFWTHNGNWGKRMEVNSSGNVVVTQDLAASAVILKSPNFCFRITVDDAGALTTVKVTCP